MPAENRGFTLIELLVTVTIMLIITGGSIAGFIQFKDRQQVLNTAKDVQQFLRTAQSKARVRETPIGAECNSIDKRLQGFKVNFTTPLTMQPLCGSDSNYAGATAQSVVESMTIGNTVTLNGAPTFINFYTLNRGTSLPPTPPNPVTTLTFTNGGNVYHFTIDSNGTISNVE